MAKRVEFLRDFCFHVKPSVTIRYRKGSVVLVPDAHAREAIGRKAARLAAVQTSTRSNVG